MNHHQPSNDIAITTLSARIHDSRMICSFWREAKEIVVLGKDDPIFVSRPLQLVRIRDSQGSCLWNSQDIHAAPTKSPDHCPCNLFIRVKPDSRHG